ncbi:MAG: hypothetical protein WCE69_15020 [Aestuariivirga sp.]
MTRLLPFMLLLFLAACGTISQPFGKLGPPERTPAILTPPWEAMVAAGPGASKEIDLETLNGPGTQRAVAEAPEEPPPGAKGGRLVIKAVAVIPVKGAKGMGNDELTRAMRQALTTAGWTVLSAPAKNALTISGRVQMAEASGNVQKVALQWAVQAPDGGKLGDVNQANNVPAGSLDSGWGDIAGFAVEAAASGIFELINKFR